MVDQQKGKIVEVKNELFLETIDPNNARKKLQIPVKSIPGLAKTEMKAGAELGVLLSKPLRYIVSVVVPGKIPQLCYIPAPEMYMAVAMEPGQRNAVAKNLLDKNLITKTVYEKIIG